MIAPVITPKQVERFRKSRARAVLRLVSAALFIFCLLTTLAAFAVGYWLLLLPWGVALIPAAGLGIVTAFGSWRGLRV
jgi:hypothetical protein